MERVGNLVIKILLVFLLILVLFDLLDWYHVIYAESTQSVLSNSGEISIFNFHFSFKPVIWFIFDVYSFLRLAGLFVFGVSGVGSIVYLIFAVVTRVFFRGQLPFLFALKSMIVSLFGVYCSQYDVIRDFCVDMFNKIGSMF